MENEWLLWSKWISEWDTLHKKGEAVLNALASDLGTYESSRQELPGSAFTVNCLLQVERRIDSLNRILKERMLLCSNPAPSSLSLSNHHLITTSPLSPLPSHTHGHTVERVLEGMYSLKDDAVAQHHTTSDEDEDDLKVMITALQNYESEYQMKEAIIKDLASDTSSYVLTTYVTCWQTQPFLEKQPMEDLTKKIAQIKTNT